MLRSGGNVICLRDDRVEDRRILCVTQVAEHVAVNGRIGLILRHDDAKGVYRFSDLVSKLADADGVLRLILPRGMKRPPIFEPDHGTRAAAVSASCR